MELFGCAWNGLLEAVAETPDAEFEGPSGCAGWSVRDLVCHLVIDAQDVLITLVTPAEGPATADAAGYWKLAEPPAGDDPLDALVPRLAAAYGEPRWLKFHLDDVGSAAGRAATLADPAALVSTQDMVLSVEDYLAAYVLEATLHHLDLIQYRPGATEPPAETLAAARAGLEKIAGEAFPASFTDADALRVGTGRRLPTGAEAEALAGFGAKLPLILG